MEAGADDDDAEEEVEEEAASSEGVVSLSAMQVLYINKTMRGAITGKTGRHSRQIHTSSSFTTPSMELPDARNLRLSWAAEAAMVTRAARSLRAAATSS